MNWLKVGRIKRLMQLGDTEARVVRELMGNQRGSL